MEGPRTLLSALLHFGTLVSVLFLFKKRIWGIALSLFDGSRDERKYLVNLIIATIPIVVVGLAAKGWIEASFNSTRVTGVSLMVTGAILWSLRYVERANKRIDNLSWKESIPIGLAQVGALFPGISRSGVTISAGLLKGLEPDFAAEFSFLLMVPAVLGANVLKVSEGLLAASGSSVELLGYVLGTATSAITGIIAIKLLLKVIRKGKLSRFSYYCLPVGAAVVIWSFL